MRRGRLRAVSRRRAGLLRQRRELQQRAVRTTCPRCQREPADETHETLRRAQYAAAAADLVYMVQLGARCHSWVGNHPEDAHIWGWVLWSYERGDDEAIWAAQQARLDWELRGLWRTLS